MTAVSLGLRWAIETCRSGAPGPAADFVGGSCFDPVELLEFIPEAELEDLCSNDLVRSNAGQAQFEYQLTNHNNLVSVLPAEQALGPDFVHVNQDTFWLLRLAWEHAQPGQSAVDLGTGNGIVAAHLVARYRHVVATDLPGPWMRYAQLTLAANAARGRPSEVIASDVASGLRPGSFDLVASNSPWSPDVSVGPNGRQLTFMAGGPTGTELPRRFLREGAELLRPGGVAIILCFDPEFDDGSRPLKPILEGLKQDGYGLECVESPVYPTDVVTAKLKAGPLPNLVRGRHIAVVIRSRS